MRRAINSQRVQEFGFVVDHQMTPSVARTHCAPENMEFLQRRQSEAIGAILAFGGGVVAIPPSAAERLEQRDDVAVARRLGAGHGLITALA